MSDLKPIQATNISASHGFFTRVGGVSLNPVTAQPTDLNCGFLSGDNSANLIRNRELVRQNLGATALLSVHQVHSNKVVIVTPDLARNWDFDQQADGLVTKEVNIAIGAMSADCGPVLFHDPTNQIIGAAHAGWGGAIGGILENTVETMEALGAKADNIHAALGPCIQQASYEVGPEFYQQFCDKSQAYTQYFNPSPKPERWQFDLAGFVVDRLRAMGLASVRSSGHDTCADEQNFFSHRRGTLTSIPDRMRHISAIKL